MQQSKKKIKPQQKVLSDLFEYHSRIPHTNNELIFEGQMYIIPEAHLKIFYMVGFVS